MLANLIKSTGMTDRHPSPFCILLSSLLVCTAHLRTITKTTFDLELIEHFVHHFLTLRDTVRCVATCQPAKPSVILEQELVFEDLETCSQTVDSYMLRTTSRAVHDHTALRGSTVRTSQQILRANASTVFLPTSPQQCSNTLNWSHTLCHT